MPNLHTPERQPGETTKQRYRARQAESARVVRLMVKGPTQAPHIQIPGGPPPNWVHWWLGQHTNPERNARRAAIAASGGIRQFKKLRRGG